MKSKIFDLFLLAVAAFVMLGTLNYFRQTDLLPTDPVHFLNTTAQNTNTYLGPNQPIPGDPDLIRVQILLYNDPNPKGLTIQSASFDGTNIPLKPRDIHGYRGQASFQKRPGKYRLQWVAERDQINWPRTVEREEEVYLDRRDGWVQITIIGDVAEIS